MRILSQIYASLSLLDRSSKKRLSVILAIQVTLGGLDLLAVGIVGIIGALSVSGVQSGTPGGRVSQVIDFIQLDNFSFQNQVAILGVAAVLLFVSKTVISIRFTKRILVYLGSKSAALSSRVIAEILRGSHDFIRTRNNQELIHNSTFAVNACIIGVVGGAITLIADISLTVLLCLTLFLVDPIVAFISVSVLGVVLLVLNKATHEQANKLGSVNRKLAIKTNQDFESALGLYRELTVSCQIEQTISDLTALRREHSMVAANLAFLPNISKYVLETSVVLSALLISAIQFISQDSAKAVAGLAIFLAAGSRIAPALLRIQQGNLAIQSNYAYAQQGFQLIKQFNSSPTVSRGDSETSAEDFKAEIEIRGLRFGFTNSDGFSLKIPNLLIHQGMRVAIVGPSGSGKSTLVDLILGILQDDTDSIRVSGESPRKAISKWRTEISYVPQEVYIKDGTIRDNLLIDEHLCYSDEDVHIAMKNSQLESWLASQPAGLQTTLGSKGITLSGGQRQRIGICRALIRKPKLIVLDEATSSLDAESENYVSQTLSMLPPETTVVMIAHRLSSIVQAEKVIYLNNGQVVFEGTFEEVRRNVPDFDRQAKLMGL
jgi:ABC-type multidrug transport system fused ATPase/permease subunit